jgi:hypothetical protein
MLHLCHQEGRAGLELCHGRLELRPLEQGAPTAAAVGFSRRAQQPAVLVAARLGLLRTRASWLGQCPLPGPR